MLSKRNILIGALISAMLATNASGVVQEEPPDISSRFTFARTKYGGPLVTRATLFGQGIPPWAHDYPRGGRHLMKIVNELTGVEGNPDEVILTLDDPKLFKYPFAYLC